MPGEQRHRAPPPAMTRDLPPCQVASGTGGPSQPLCEDSAPASRTAKTTGSRAQAAETPEPQPQQPKAPPLRTHPRSSPPAPARRSLAQARMRRASRADGSPPQQLFGLGISGSRARPTLDKNPEGPQHKAPGPPEAETPATPEELSCQRCFQETPTNFTSTNYTSPSTTPRPQPHRAPQNSGASPCHPASYSEFQTGRADFWPPTAENNFPGASFGVLPTEPEPFPEDSSPRGASFQYRFPALHGAGLKAFPEDTAGPKYAERALAFTFPQPRGAWPEEVVGADTAYPVPTRPAAPPQPCYPGRPSGPAPPADLTHAPHPPGAAPSAPSPFSERPPSAHDGLGSPRGPPSSLPQRHLPQQAYGSPGASGVGTSAGSPDTELATPGPLPARLPQLWDPAAAPYPTPPLGPPAATRSAFFEGQPSPGQRRGLPHSPPLPWPQALPATGPSPHRMEMLSQPPLPSGAPEWQGVSQGGLGAAGKTPGHGEKLTVLRKSPGQPGGGSPGLFPYNGLKDPGAQSLFFGVAQPQVSPRGTPGLPPPRVVGASPSESPLPSPVTNTAGSSSCSSLSPLSSSPANPSSEESQLPGPLGTPIFFHAPPPPQESCSPFPSPEPSHTIPICCQQEPNKAFPFPADELGAKGAFPGLGEAPFPSTGPELGSGGLEGFPQEPPPYSAHHFPLSSASLDQLDVLLTCRQCDRNYSSLATFLQHRQFCGLLLAGARDGAQQPPGLPVPPATHPVPATPTAPASADPSLLSLAKGTPFLLGGDVPTEGRDDPLRASLLPSLAATPFPLPASDLDLEDDAKLDSLITEALNGLGYQSDSPEIDSSFIDVFTDEEPSGPRGPSTGQPSKTRAGAAPENKAHPPLPPMAAPPRPQAPRPGDGHDPTHSRPKTRSLGPASVGPDGAGLASQQRRGKRFKVLQKELGAANGVKRPGRGARAARLRPRRKAGRAEAPPSCPQDLGTQVPKSPADPHGRALPVETRSAKRLRLCPRKDSRRRRARGTWSKELIHKIVQQKNKRLQDQGPSAADARHQDCASESEDEGGARPRGSRCRGQPRLGCRRPRSTKGREAALTPGPRERRPERLLPVPTSARTPDNHPVLDFLPETRNPETAEEPPPGTTELLREDSSPSPATRVGGSPCPPSPEQLQPGREGAVPPHRGSPAPCAGSHLGAPQYMEPPTSQNKEEIPAHPPGKLPVPVADAADAASPKPNVLFLKPPDLGCDPALLNGHSTGVSAAKRGSQPYRHSPSEVFLVPKDLVGCLHKDPCSKPFVPDTLPASSAHLCQDGVDASSPEPKLPRNLPCTIDSDPGRAESPLSLETTPLFSGLPMDRFNPPIYNSPSGGGDTHSSCVHADPPPRKPGSDPLFPLFLPEKGWSLLEEVSSILPCHTGHFPDPSGEKAFTETCPGGGTATSSTPSLPGKVSEGSIPFMSNLSEDELEIKRLVTELESQLRSKGANEASGSLCRAGHTDRTHLGTAVPPHVPQAASPQKDASATASLTSLRELSLHLKEADKAMVTADRTPGHPREDWSSSHQGEGEAALLPRAYTDMVPGAPFDPTGASFSFQPVQKARVSGMEPPEAEGDCGVCPEACVPGPREPLEPPWDIGSLAKCSPNHEPVLPKNNVAARIHPRTARMRQPPCPRGGGLSPGSSKEPGPCQDPPELEVLGSAAAHLAPDLAFRGATPPSGVSHSDTSKGHPVSRAGGPERAGFLHPVAGGADPEGSEGFAPIEASSSPACTPLASPGRRPPDPGASPLQQLQLLVARAAEREEDTRDLQGPPGDTQSPRHSKPSDLEGNGVRGGNRAWGCLGAVQMAAVPAETIRQLGPEADGHPGSLGQTEKPDNREGPGVPGGLTAVHAKPGTALARLASGEDQPPELLQGGRVVSSPQEGACTPSPISSEVESLVPAWAAARAQNGPKDWTPEAVTNPGLEKHLRLTGESPEPPFGELAGRAPSPTSAASPVPHSLQHLPGEDNPTAPSGELTAPLPAPPRCRDPTSLQPLPAHSPAQTPPKKNNGTPAPTDGEVGRHPAAPPSLRTSACGLEDSLARRPLLRDHCPLEDPPKGQLSFPSVLTATHSRDHPEGHLQRALEDARKERPRVSPAHDTLPPTGRAVSAKVTIKAAALPCTPGTEGMGAVRGPKAGGPGPHYQEALPNTCPKRTSEHPSSEPPGNRADQGVSTVPADLSTLQGAAGPDPHVCQQSEAGTCFPGQEDLGTPGARHPSFTEVSEAGIRAPVATCPTSELRPDRAMSLSGATSGSRPSFPQGLGNALHHTTQRAPLSPQDPRQEPHGFKKKPMATENGHWKDQATSRQPVTCEVCSASFHSGPGLSHHRAGQHGLHKAAASQPSPLAPPIPQAQEPQAQVCRLPRKKSRRAPRKEKPRSVIIGPHHAMGLPPVLSSPAPEDTPGSETCTGLTQGFGILQTPGYPPSQEPQPLGLAEPGVDMRPAESRKQGLLERGKPQPQQAERGSQRRGRARWDSPRESEGTSNDRDRERKQSARGLWDESEPCDVISDRSGWNPSTAIANYPAPMSRCPSPEAEQETDVPQLPGVAPPGPERTEGTAGVVPEAMLVPTSPRDWMACPGRNGGPRPGEGPEVQKPALARGCWGPTETLTAGACKEASQAAQAKPEEDSRVAESGSRQGIWEEPQAPSGPPGPPETCASEADGAVNSFPQEPPRTPEAQARIQEQEDATPRVSSLDLGDPLSLLDDEASFSRLFPLSNRFTRVKNPRVYGKRCKKPKSPPQQEPLEEAGGSTVLASIRLPTDLSDSGSLCLSHEDPWGDQATDLPESFLLEGFLSSKVPGIDLWAPGPSLWALEPDPGLDCAKEVPSRASDPQSENLPELHMVPAAWRGLELQAPTADSSSSLGAASPEPPDLQREHYDESPPGRTAEPEMLSTEPDPQGLCLLGPCEDPAGGPGTSFFDPGVTGGSQGPQSRRTEDRARAGRGTGRARHAKAGGGPYKCRACFQRFRGPGELDLHRLAHSPSPPPTCYMCVERRFGSRELLREHLQEKHAQSKTGRWACGMCLREALDVWVHNEHLREHALRFARRGQARRPLGGLPGCWEADGRGTDCLGGPSGRASTPHRGKLSEGRANAGATDAPRQETGAGRAVPSQRARPKARGSDRDGARSPDGALAHGSPAACASPTPPGSSAPLSGSAETPPGPGPGPQIDGETLLRAARVHGDCRDPSRDCHHCGKRFPKPFKLQRHLAVHSPQRVYLCPQCPRVYPEHQELRAHLAGAHGRREERELQHTPLYACELCADVTLTSRRSFACSSCNYTFAKKAQFDRHMDKHLRRGQQPFSFRGVRRPGTPGQKAPAREGTMPSKRRRVAVPSSATEPSMNRPPAPGSEGSPSSQLQPCLEAAPRTPERPVGPVGHPVSGGSPPSDLPDLLPPSLSPFPAALADDKDVQKPDRNTLEGSEGEASPGRPGPLLQQILPLGGSLPRPGARHQDEEERRAAGPFSGKRRTPSARGHTPEAPSPLRKEKQVPTCHMAPEAGKGGPSHKGSATKPGGCQSSSKDRSALSTPSKAPKFPVQPKKAVASPTARELAHGIEDRPKPTTPRAKPGPSSHGGGGPLHSTKTAGGSHPGPAGGQLQSETATTPAKPTCPGRGSAPARGHPKGPRNAGGQGPRGSLGPQDDGEVSQKKKKGRAPGPTRSESVRSLGRVHLVPEKPPRLPRKQATPSRVPPARPRPSRQTSPLPPQPSEQQRAEPSHTHGDFKHSREGLGKAVPQARPPHRPPKRGRAVHGAEPANPRTCRTAASQSDLLSQLFGQRLTSFKIPLKKDPPE